MVRAPKAKKSEDGKGYEQNGRKRKAGLNKAIQDAGIGQIRSMLESKASNHPNREVVRVNAKHTSQRCSRCGHTEKENRETQASFKCLSCGLSINADLNAAINMEMEAFGYLDRKDE
jgi:transposase